MTYRLKKILECWVKGQPSRELGWKHLIIETVKRELSKDFYPSSAVSLKLDFYLYNYETNDIDNLTKSVMDALKVAGLFKDDNAVYHLEAMKERPYGGVEGVKIQAWKWAVGLERGFLKEKGGKCEENKAQSEK